MKLSFIFELLASGELANLHLSKDAKEIQDDKKEIVLRSINLGLIDLHHRFNLRRKQVDILTDKSLKVYQVTDPELIEIITVTLGLEKQCINLDYRMMSVNTIEFSEYPRDKETMSIEYKAKHRVLTQQDIIDDSEVELPMVYVNALLSFIASRLYTSIVNQLDGDLNESNRYAQRYIQEIQLLEQQGIDVDNLTHHNWFNQRGFI